MREIKKRLIKLLDMAHERHKKTVLKTVDQQERKGIETYGHPLEDADPKGWNWDKMTLEELVDALQYQIKENILLESELKDAEEMLTQYQMDYNYLEEELSTVHQQLDDCESELER